MLYLHYYTDDIKNSQPSELFDASSGIKIPGKRERINDAKAGKKEKFFCTFASGLSVNSLLHE